MDERKVYTEQEACKYLRLSSVTLWRLRRTGQITHRRALGKILYTQADLDGFIESVQRNGDAYRKG